MRKNVSWLSLGLAGVKLFLDAIDGSILLLGSLKKRSELSSSYLQS
jgi:hypothetical protein